MKTTLDLDDDLILAIKRRALDQGTTMTAIIEDALRKHLSPKPKPEKPFKLKLKPVRGKLRPGVDLDSRDSLYEIMEGTRWRGDRG